MDIYEGFVQTPPNGAWYRVTDVRKKHPYREKACLMCDTVKLMQTRATAQYCSKSCAQSTNHNSRWTQTPKYITQHHRVYAVRGKASNCVWGCDAEEYQWANLLGDYSDIDDYASMCVPCHAAFDGSISKCFDTICDRGHSFEKDGYYSRITSKGEARQCKQCAKDRANARRKGKNVDHQNLDEREIHPLDLFRQPGQHK